MFNFTRLFDLCQERGVSKKYLCELSGKNSSYIADLRRLGREPKSEDVTKWAEALQTSEEYLLGETDKKEKPTGDVLAGLEGFDDLTPENQAFIRKQIELLKALQSNQ